jgi:sterol desaturase/sphingolipid hydroxylase (fatty acid hydroxylase superfamily)
MSLDPTVIAIPVYFLLIGIELIVHRVQSTKSYRLNDAVTNINCGVTSQVSGAFLKVLTIGLYTVIYDQFRLFTVTDGWLTWIMAFVAYDFCYYWAHRMSHEVNLFWGGHSVHHQSEEYNLSVALRQSSTQTIWTFFFYFPMAMAGINPYVLISVSGFNLLYQFWIHTESINRLPKWFEAVMNTPSHHRVHHARNPKYIDKNHAGTFIIWDKLFGTFKEEEEKPTYGITKNLNSWNPVWANVAHYADIWQDLKRIPKWQDKLRFIVKKPGWLPEEMGGYREPYDVDLSSYKKYDVQAAKGLNLYVLLHYVVLLAGTALFLFSLEGMSSLDKVLLASVITVSVVSFGGLFESRVWAFPLELFRLIAVPLSIIYYVSNFSPGPYLLLGSALFLIPSVLWLVKVRPLPLAAKVSS